MKLLLMVPPDTEVHVIENPYCPTPMSMDMDQLDKARPDPYRIFPPNTFSGYPLYKVWPRETWADRKPDIWERFENDDGCPND